MKNKKTPSLTARMVELERGDDKTITLDGIVKIDLNLSWQDELTVTISFKKVEIDSRLEQLLGEAHKGVLADDSVFDEYIRAHHSHMVSDFQKKIDSFDSDAQDWGITYHNDYLAFYKMHVW